VSEGISLTVLEAMAAGLPIVATDVGGNREVVVQGDTGLLVPARSPDAMAQAILTILRQPHLGRSMGKAGRIRGEREFDLRLVVQKYEQLYEHLLGQNAHLLFNANHQTASTLDPLPSSRSRDFAESR